MPKVKIRPTPAQGRLLRALAENEGLRLVWYEKRAGEFMGRGQRKVKSEIGNPRNVSLRQARDQEWIVKDDGWYGNWMISEVGHEAIGDLDDEYLFPTPAGMTANDIRIVLRKLHPTQSPAIWAWTEELWIAGWNRRVDAFAIRLTAGEYDSPYLQKIAYEIKVDRADFRKDVADPHKRSPAMEFCNRFYYVAPHGVIPLNEIPEDCGLLEIREDHTIRIRKKAPELSAANPTWDLLAAFARALQR